MMHLPITGFYAGILTLIYIWLAVGVIRIRRRERVALHDGGNASLLAAIRAHGNFAEYTVLFLFLLMLLEAGQLASPLMLHLLAISFTLGRLSHAYSLTQYERRPVPIDVRFRAAGMVMTFTTLGIMALTLIF